MVTIARVIMCLLALALCVQGFAVVVLKKYRYMSGPSRRSVSRRRALWGGISMLMLGPWLMWESVTTAPFLAVIMAFIMLVSAACLVLMWRTEAKSGAMEQDSLEHNSQHPSSPA